MLRWVFVGVLLLALPVQAQQLDSLFSFSAPAQADGSLTVSNARWAVLTFGTAKEAAFHLRLEGPLTETNYTTLVFENHLLGGPTNTVPMTSVDAKDRDGPLEADLDFSERPGSLILQGQSIQLSFLHATASLWPLPEARGLGNGWRDAGPAESYRVGWPVPAGSAFALSEAASFSLRVEGLRSVEWHNATLSCSSAACPKGDGWSGVRHGLPNGDHVSADRFVFTEVKGQGGQAAGTGKLVGALFGGASLDAALNGTVRLPLARLESACEACLEPQDQTMTISGLTEFRSIEPLGESRLRSGVHAAPSFIRLDETDLGVPLAVGAATAGTLLVALALLRLLPLLAARVLDRDALLRLPSRRLIHEAVCADPGISFNQLVKKVGLSRSTVEYHLRLLCWGQLLVAERDGNRIRYYENHGRYARIWREQAGLRDSQQRLLHSWLLLRPGLAQADVLAHATGEWGWSRTTTCRRLEQLERSGLAASERNEGRKRYRAIVPDGPLPAVS